MGKLFFKYGVMGSAKTAEALMCKFRYEEIGQTCLFCKTRIDTRDGARVVKSRIGLSTKNVPYLDEILSDKEVIKKADVLIVDEAQFATNLQIDKLAEICDTLDKPVICYGLKTDFQGHLFEGSKRLLEVADKTEEIKQVCWCGKKALFNARVLDGVVVREGEQVVLGGDEKYVALCRKHFNEGKISANHYPNLKKINLNKVELQVLPDVIADIERVLTRKRPLNCSDVLVSNIDKYDRDIELVCGFDKEVNFATVNLVDSGEILDSKNISSRDLSFPFYLFHEEESGVISRYEIAITTPSPDDFYEPEDSEENGEEKSLEDVRTPDMSFSRLVNIANELINKGFLTKDPKNKNNILVYRNKGENNPEGWYSENLLESMSETWNNPKELREFLKVAKAMCVDTDKCFKNAQNLLSSGESIFSSPEDMLLSIQAGIDYYNPDFKLFVSVYNDCGSIIDYSGISPEEAERLEKKCMERGESSWLAFLGSGGEIWDSKEYMEENPDENDPDDNIPDFALAWCKEYWDKPGWINTYSLRGLSLKNWEIRAMYDGTFHIKSVFAYTEEAAMENFFNSINRAREYHIFSITER